MEDRIPSGRRVTENKVLNYEKVQIQTNINMANGDSR